VNTKTITQFPDAPDIESSTWDYASRFSGVVGEWLLAQQVNATRQAIKTLFNDASPLKVLDVGGGHGQNIALMKELGHELQIVGSDPTCREVIQSELDNGGVDFQVASLIDLPFEDNTFDLVICYRILSHMASWEKLIAEMVRVSKRAVVVDYPSRRSFNIFSSLLFVAKKRIEKNTRPYGCYSDRQIDRAFQVQGYQPVFRHRQFFLPMAMYRLVNRLHFSRRAAALFRSLGLTSRFGSPVISGYTKNPADNQQ